MITADDQGPNKLMQTDSLGCSACGDSKLLSYHLFFCIHSPKFINSAAPVPNLLRILRKSHIRATLDLFSQPLYQLLRVPFNQPNKLKRYHLPFSLNRCVSAIQTTPEQHAAPANIIKPEKLLWRRFRLSGEALFLDAACLFIHRPNAAFQGAIVEPESSLNIPRPHGFLSRSWIGYHLK